MIARRFPAACALLLFLAAAASVPPAAADPKTGGVPAAETQITPVVTLPVLDLGVVSALPAAEPGVLQVKEAPAPVASPALLSAQEPPASAVPTSAPQKKDSPITASPSEASPKPLDKPALAELKREAAAQAHAGPFDYPSDTKIKIDGRALGKAMARATADSGHPISLNKGRYEAKSFFEYLYALPQRPRDYETGKEEELKKWILSRPDNSIDPLSLYKQSLDVNGGNVWGALLTIHQLLRNHARYFDRHAYFTDLNEPDVKPLFNKLVDIRGDLADRDASLKGDHRGTWYRIWGIMLYRVAQEKSFEDLMAARSQGKSLSLTEHVRQWGRYFRGQAVASLAEWVKPFIMFGESDKRKAEINRSGATTAHVFIKALYTGKDSPPSSGVEDAPSRYLRSK